MDGNRRLFASQMIGLMAIYYLVAIFLFLYFSYGFFNGIERARKLAVYYIIINYGMNFVLMILLPNVLGILIVIPVFVLNAFILYYISGKGAKEFFESVTKGARIEPIRITGLG